MGRSAKQGRKQVSPQGGQGAWEGGREGGTGPGTQGRRAVSERRPGLCRGLDPGAPCPGLNLRGSSEARGSASLSRSA